MEVKINAEPINEKEKKNNKPDKWEIDCWARTLLEAEEIKNDPKKMKYVKEVINEKHDAMKGLKMSLEDIKKKAADMPMEEEDEY